MYQMRKRKLPTSRLARKKTKPSPIDIPLSKEDAEFDIPISEQEAEFIPSSLETEQIDTYLEKNFKGFDELSLKEKDELKVWFRYQINKLQEEVDKEDDLRFLDRLRGSHRVPNINTNTTTTNLHLRF